MQPDKTHYRKTELAGVAFYFGWVFGVALSMPTWAETFGWVMVSHAVAGTRLRKNLPALGLM